MPSRTIWQDVYDDPRDDARWAAFRRHYEKRVYTWAVGMLKPNLALADEVTVEVFRRLFELVQDPGRAPVTPRDGTCAGFVFRAVQSICRSHFRTAQARARLTDELRARLESDESRRYLERLITDAEREEERREADRRMAAYRDRFARAAGRYRETQSTLKEQGQSWEMFLAAYGADPEPGQGLALDARFGCKTRGYALKAAHRVAEALMREMGLPHADGPDWDRAEIILRELVKRHGDPTE